MAHPKRKRRLQKEAEYQPVFEINNINPLTENQKKAFQSFKCGKNLLLSGCPGTGKSFIALGLAINEVMDPCSAQSKVLLVRSAVSSKDVGFLPGSLKEKIKILETPYISICANLFNGRSDTYEYLKTKNLLEFSSTSYMRGLTYNNTIIIVDEVQNLEWRELFAITTRMGQNSRIIFCGDYKQSDLTNNFVSCTKKEDILKFIKVVNHMKSFASVTFTSADIVRSGIVREFIMAIEDLGIDM